jgi:hypothetical protein
MQATITLGISILGESIPNLSIDTNDVDGGFKAKPTLAAGKAGSLTTRSSGSAGIVTTTGDEVLNQINSSGLAQNDVVDVFWDGGRMHSATVSGVNGSAVTFSGGSGDSLPDQGTTVVICKQTVLAANIDPDNMDVLVAYSTKRTSVAFVTEAGAVLYAIDLPGGKSCALWWADSQIARPMTGDPVTKVRVSNGISSGTNTPVIAVQFEAIAT